MMQSTRNDIDRAVQLRRVTAAMLRDRSPQDRDRILQRHLALVRGARWNAAINRRVTARLLEVGRKRRGEAPIMLDDPLIDSIQVVTAAFERWNVPYAITGSVASSVHGEPWTSEDIDFVVQMSPEQVAKVVSALGERFYLNADGWLEEACRHGFVNLIDQKTGLKIDISMLSPSPFHDAIFRRRTITDLGGAPVQFQIVSPEDIILMKLEWRRDSRSSKQWENALSVARAQGARMDWRYLFEQARALDIVADLEQLRDEAGI